MTRTLRVLFVAVGLAIIALLVRNAGPIVVLRMIARVGWMFLAITAIYAVYVVIRALALWRTILGHTVRYFDTLRIRVSGEAVEWLTLTGPFLAEPAKGWLLTRRGVSTDAAFAAVVTEYLLYTVAAAALASFALALLLSQDMLPQRARVAGAVVLLAMCAFLVTFAYASASARGLIVPVLRRVSRLIGRRRADLAVDAFGPVENVIISFLHERPRRLAEVLALEAAAHAALIVELRVIIRALGFSSSWFDAALIEGGIKFVGLAFAFIPGQLGASEGVYTVLATAVGLPAAAGVSIALVRRLRGLITAAAGLVMLAFRDR